MIIIIKKDTTVKIRTRFIKEKMFVKVSLMSFVYNIIDVFCFPTTEVLDIYKQKKIIKCIVFLNSTDTDRGSVSFVFVCDFESNISETDARHLIFKIMLQSKLK